MIARAFAGFSMLLALGCGAEEPVHFVSNEDPSLVVSGLTDAQASDLCLAMLDYYDEVQGAHALPRASCLALGVSAATESECAMRRDDCVASIPDDAAARRSSCELDITAVRSGCDATIAQVERCIDETAALLGGVLGGSCADAPVETVAGTRYDTGSPASCRALSARCSELVLRSSRAAP